MSQQLTPASVSVIENELPNYRAITPLAVVSLVLGIGAVFTFADRGFAVLGLAAVVLGAIALRKINRYPDLLTGRALAQVGIGLGMLFALSALTFGAVRQARVEQSANRFGRQFARTLAAGDVPKVMWLRIPPHDRETITPADNIKKIKDEGDPAMQQMVLGPVEMWGRNLREPNREMIYRGIEDSGYDGVQPYAFAVVSIRPKDNAEAQEVHALIELRADTDHGGFEWWVKEFAYPYTPKTAKLQPKPVDDGHGHSH